MTTVGDSGGRERVGRLSTCRSYWRHATVRRYVATRHLTYYILYNYLTTMFSEPRIAAD
jgi:hypothetical protein